MPYRRSRSSSSRRRYRRRYRQMRRSRPAYRQKRRFNKSNKKFGVIRAQVLPDSLFVKLTYAQNFDVVIPNGGSRAFPFQGNGLAPYTEAGLQIPPTGVGNIPTVGDWMASGIQAYNKLYNRYYVLASKISIQCTLVPEDEEVPVIPTRTITAILLAESFDHFSSSTTSAEFNDSWQNVVQRLLFYEDNQMISYPYAQSKTIGPPTSGKDTGFFKMFRRTKDMYGVKDVVDDSDMIGYLKDTTSSTLGDLDQVNPHSGYMYYFRVFNDSTIQDIAVLVRVKMTFYCKLTGRSPPVQLMVEDISTALEDPNPVQITDN